MRMLQLMPRAPFLIILFALILLPLRSELRLELSRDTIALDERVSLDLRVQSGGMSRAPELEMPKGLRVVGNQFSSHSINGRFTAVHTYILQADEPGTYQIGPFETTNGIRIEGETLTVTPPQVVRSTEEFEVRLEASSNRVLVRETIDLTLTFLSKERINRINITDFPSEGLESTQFREQPSSAIIRNGKRLQQRSFLAQVTPTQLGTLTFDPTFKVEIPVMGSPRSMILGPGQVRVERIKLENPLLIEVIEPPSQGQPDGYTGSVGTFQMRATISPSKVNVGDPITLQVTLEGEGSIKQALPPRYDAAQGFKVYQPNIVSENIHPSGQHGRKTLEQVIIPTDTALSELPEIAFHYFQPETQTYQTLSAGPFPITVNGEPMEPITEDSMALLPEPFEEEPLGEDLLYIKRNPGALLSLDAMSPGMLYGTSAGLPFLLWAFATLFVRQREIRAKDPVRQRKMLAPKRLQERLNTLESSQELWTSLWDAISGTIRDHQPLPLGSNSTSDILSSVSELLSKERLAELQHWCMKCEEARFAGAHQEDSPALRKEAAEFVKALYREVRT